jgi:putative ABC transport system permease protein
MFLRTPGFTITALTALALGIGANVAIFSVANAVLLRPVPAPDPDHVVVFLTNRTDGTVINGGSPARFNAWRELGDIFTDISAYRYGGINLTGVDSPSQVQWGQVSASYFRLFGLAAARGRTFTPEEDRPNAGRFAVLGDGFWKRSFAADPKVLGRTLSLGGDPYVVIGIMPPGVATESPLPVDVWTPFQIDPAGTEQNHYFTVAARVRPGITPGMIQARLKVASEDFLRKFPGVGTMLPGYTFAVLPMRDLLVRDARPSLLILAGAVSFVLLIACANVANLLLVRAAGRKREIAIRAAVGASRFRIIGQLLMESLTLSMAGGALGLLAGILGIRGILALNPGNIPRIGPGGANVAADWRVLAFALAISAGTGILFGLIPAFQAARVDLSSALKEGGGRMGSGFRQNKARSLLVVCEMALALVLLTGSGLLIRTFIVMHTAAPGFDPHPVLTLQIQLSGARFQNPSNVVGLVGSSLERLRALPGVEAAASSCCLPVGPMPFAPLVITGRPLNGTFHSYVAEPPVSPDFFDVFKIPIVRGRRFTERDNAASPPVVIINQAMVRRFWPNGDALGAQIRMGAQGSPTQGGEMEIVGVAGDVHDRTAPSGEATLVAYIPLGQAGGLLSYVIRQPFVWMVRTRNDRQSMSAALKTELQEATGGLPVTGIRSMDEYLARSTATQDFNVVLMLIFGGSALLLAAIGIYGLIAYTVQQRTQEIGIRLAMGAGRARVRNMIVAQGMRLVLVGVAIGVAAAYGLTRLLASFLIDVKPRDPLVFTAVPVMLIVVALFAAWLPARRVARIDPSDALRCE